MNKQRLTFLLEQYTTDKATEAERQELFSFVQSPSEEELFKQVVSDLMQHESPSFPADAAPWQKMVQDIMQIDKGVSMPGKKAAVFTLYRWAAAAAILLLVSATVYFFMNQKHSTLATTGKSSTFKVVSTANSKQQEVVLPDGSHVWLNSASSIRFPESFSDKERLVELTGEAWFDVQHADKKPFVIHSGRLTTTVMGTAFDIRAYPDQHNMEVAVQRGRVKVQSGNTLLAVLEKGQKFKVSADGSHSHFPEAIDTANVAAWKRGDLYYKDEMLGDIIADLQRVFNTTIEIKSASMKQEVTTASFNRNTDLRKALEIICRINGARLIEKNGTYIIE